MDGRKLIGWNVRKLRVIKGFSIEELADRAGLGDSFVSKLERGQVNASIGNLELLAKPLGAKLSDLVIEPKPGERPPAPLKAGRRSQRQSAIRDSGSLESRERARELLAQELRRGKMRQNLSRLLLHLLPKDDDSDPREVLRRLQEIDWFDPQLTRLIDQLLAEVEILPKDFAAKLSMPKGQMPERVRGDRQRRNPHGLTRGRSPH